MKSYLKNPGFLLEVCYCIFLLLSWVILFRDGRGLFTFVDFYPSIRPFVDSATIFLQKIGINFIPTIVFAATTILAFYLYFLSLRKKITLKKTVAYSVVFQITTFFAYPVLARDIFYYIFSDRVLNVYHENVWQVPVGQFLFDKFSKTDWQVQTKVYGGINQFFYNFASFASGNDFIQSLFSYKMLALIFSLATIYAVYQIAKKFFPKKKALLLRFIFWNPLFVLEIAGAGHNDILMMFFLVLSLYFYLSKQWIFTGAALALSVGVKFASIVVFPFLLLDALAKRQVKDGLLFAASFLSVSLLTFKYMGVEPIFFIKRVIENAGVYWQGLPSLAYSLFPVKTSLFTFGAILSALVLAAYQIIKKSDPFMIYTASIFLYLVFFASAYWNWYVLWIFIVTPFLKENALTKAVFALTFTSLMAYPLYWISLRFDYQNVLWQFVFYGWIFLIPLVVFAYARKNPKFLKIGEGG